MFIHFLFASLFLLIYLKDSEYYLRDVCEGEWNKFDKLAKVTLNRQTFSNQHILIIGFHLKKFCKKFFGIEKRVSKKLTTYLADDNKFMYMFITITDSIKSQSPKFNISFKKNDKILLEVNSKFLFVIWLNETLKIESNSKYYNKISYKISNKFSSDNTKDFHELTEKSDQILFKNNLFVSQNEDMNIFISIDGKDSSSEFINNLFTIENSYVIVAPKELANNFSDIQWFHVLQH
jgi:hypothetical protein